MNLKLTALPILVLLISVSTIALVNGDSSTETTAGTTSTLHVDAGNGNFFDIPYSISGATVTDVKADTSIPKMTISISATTDGQITLQVPGGDRNSASQNDFTVLVDGQNSQYTQSYENGHRMVTIPFHANSSTIEIVGQHETSAQSMQSSVSCTQDEITNAKQGIASIKEKMSQLQTQYHNDWQTAYNSGQFNGTWAQYAQENFWNLPEVSQLKATHEKYSSFLKSCFGKQTMPPQSVPQNPSLNSNLQANTTATLSSTQYQEIPSINPSDAQAIAAGHGIPGWVKQIVGWWVEGKISDSDFVTVIKFLIHQGIIKP